MKGYAYDSKGQRIGEVEPQWSTAESLGSIDAAGKFTAADGFQSGSVTAKLGDLEASARVRVFPPLPWKEDFQSYSDGQSPVSWIGAKGKFTVREQPQNNILVKTRAPRGLQRANTFIGPPSLSDYTIQADMKGIWEKMDYRQLLVG